MDKLFFLGLFILSGCNFKPPTPVSFPEGKNYFINTPNYSAKLNSVASKNKSNWEQSIQIVEMPKENEIEFWYYIQNADQIILYGKEKNIKELKDYLILRMSYKPIILVKENNRKYVNLVAQKGFLKEKNNER